MELEPAKNIYKNTMLHQTVCSHVMGTVMGTVMGKMSRKVVRIYCMSVRLRGKTACGRIHRCNVTRLT